MNTDTQSMVERVGLAIQSAWNSDDAGSLPPIVFMPHERDFLARAAIGAMREPTEAMMRAIATRALLSGSGVRAETVWYAMIDAALSGQASAPFPPSYCTAYEDCSHDGVCHDPVECGAEGPNAAASRKQKDTPNEPG